MNTDTPEEERMNEAMTVGGNVIAPLVLDPDEYREDLAEFELTEAQENELLQTLWGIMKIFVEIGWGVDCVQMFLPDLLEKNGQDSGKLVQLNHSKGFNLSAVHSVEKESNNEQSE